MVTITKRDEEAYQKGTKFRSRLAENPIYSISHLAVVGEIGDFIRYKTTDNRRWNEELKKRHLEGVKLTVRQENDIRKIVERDSLFDYLNKYSKNKLNEFDSEDIEDAIRSGKIENKNDLVKAIELKRRFGRYSKEKLKKVA
jgi:hypothetical protein